jgi:hypothetical protein
MCVLVPDVRNARTNTPSLESKVNIVVVNIVRLNQPNCGSSAYLNRTVGYCYVSDSATTRNHFVSLKLVPKRGFRVCVHVRFRTGTSCSMSLVGKKHAQGCAYT